MEIYKNLSLENVNGEIWKEIEGFDGDYFVSNYGRVKSFKRYKKRILSPNKNNHGYFKIKLSKNGKIKYKLIHVLMYENFINKVPKGCVVHHIDFTTNNILDNFQMMTISEHHSLHHKGEKHYLYGRNIPEKTKKLMKENHADFKGENHPMFGTKRPGNKSGYCKLKEQDVIKMKSFWDNNIKISNKLLSKWYKANQVTISNIKTGKSWTHIKSQSL